MEARILKVVEELESRLNIRVLLACETGSRAWGFASPDSDYDVRLLYCHPVEWYLSVDEQKADLTVMEDNDLLDITGWELRKSLQLVNKSNMAMFERLDSPIIYRQDEQFMDQMRSVVAAFYNPIAAIYHYMGIAKSCHEELTSDRDYKLKRLFYGLRTAAACQWIYEGRNGPPPIVFDKILDEISIPESTKSRVRALVELKSEKSEQFRHRGDGELLNLIGQQIQSAAKAADSLVPSRPDKDRLNLLTRDAILGTS